VASEREKRNCNDKNSSMHRYSSPLMRRVNHAGFVRDYWWGNSEFSDSRYNRGVMCRLPLNLVSETGPSPTAGAYPLTGTTGTINLEQSAYTKLSCEKRRIFGANFRTCGK
jgi:hypothetical protein